jgi:hypothetical protein
MKKFGMKEYKWSLRNTSIKKKGFFVNLKELFFNPSLDKHEWRVFSSTKRFLSVVWFVVFVIFKNINDLKDECTRPKLLF